MKSTVSIRLFLLYFLKLGSTGFGGPVVLVSHMHRDLVMKRKWISQQDYDEGLAFSQISPGPVATQLAIYLGWVRAGWVGATLTGIAFILPSFLMVICIAGFYLKYGMLTWIQAAFSLINAAVVGIIAKSAYQLSLRVLSRDLLFTLIFILSVVLVVSTGSQKISFLLGSGLIAVLVKHPLSFKSRPLSLIPLGLITGLKGPASATTLAKLFFYFSKIGFAVFGSGLAIIPFLQGGVVHTYGWLSERQFLDAIAVGMITPGPLVVTSAFIGYLAGGLFGGIAAALGIFLPVYLFVVFLAPLYRKVTQSVRAKTFVRGLTVAAVGGILGSTVVLGRGAIVDFFSAVIATVVFILLVVIPKLPEPLLIFLAGGLGVLLKLGL